MPIIKAINNTLKWKTHYLLGQTILNHSNTNMWIIEQTSINNEINKKNKKKQTVT